jgi:hypothetical protein
VGCAAIFWLITGVLLMGFYFMVNWAPTLLLRGGFFTLNKQFHETFFFDSQSYWRKILSVPRHA